MKTKELFEELLDISKKVGITVRRDEGNFNSAYCILNEEKLILLNRRAPLEIKTSVLARLLKNADLEGVFVKPAVRDFIDGERPLPRDGEGLLIDVSEDGQTE